MFTFELKEKHITKFDYLNRTKIQTFLETQGLDFDENVQYSITIFFDEEMIATGSFDNEVLKCIAIHPDYQGYGITNKLISELMNEQYRRGFEHLFVYTKPENNHIFSNLGFYKIFEIPEKVTLFENKRDGLSTYVKELTRYNVQGEKIAAIVMNCNPFTLGHKFLIEKATQENDLVHLFVVEEERSQFSSEIRYQLVVDGVKDLPNVYVHKSSKYLISAATFPSYFLKKESEIVTTHAQLDLSIFANLIAPALGVNYRYVGEETTCLVTAEYNRIMKEILPIHGVKVIEVPRLMIAGSQISASRVRKLLSEENYQEILKIVPETTYHYLINNRPGH